MTIQKWSDEIIVAELSDDPQFAEEMASLADMLEPKCFSVVINLAAITHLNSSNISALLRLRKRILTGGCRLVLCGISNQISRLFAITGLDKIFEFTDEPAAALTSIQIARPENAD